MNDDANSESQELGAPKGRRLTINQEDWLARMKRERAASPDALVRDAIDFYRPIYEATHQNLQPEVLAKVFEAVRILGPDGFISLLVSAMTGSRAPKGKRRVRQLAGAR